MITKYIKGDITNTELTYIAHGVNCQNVMGSGVAKALYTKFPEVKRSYHDYYEEKKLLYYTKPKDFLGSVNISKSGSKVIFNCFTQENFGYDNNKYVNYSAIVHCFHELKFLCSDTKKLAIPKIGCGLAGGNWDFMVELINDTVGDDLEIWVYEL